MFSIQVPCCDPKSFTYTPPPSRKIIQCFESTVSTLGTITSQSPFLFPDPKINDSSTSKSTTGPFAQSPIGPKITRMSTSSSSAFFSSSSFSSIGTNCASTLLAFAAASSAFSICLSFWICSALNFCASSNNFLAPEPTALEYFFALELTALNLSFCVSSALNFCASLNNFFAPELTALNGLRLVASSNLNVASPKTTSSRRIIFVFL
mmetsp:Transcript_400/g.1055  ORF Transcript_400/g.1055 Transcript_400/m.1055 type:complete len:208 (-) Transcript_400:367-990(-)